MINEKEWGNIELPGLSDEELYSKNWNRIGTMRELSKTPEQRKLISQGLKNVDQRAIGLKLHQDPVYKQHYLEGRKKVQVEYCDPQGQWYPSRKAAAEANNLRPRALSDLVKNPNSGWKKK